MECALVLIIRLVLAKFKLRNGMWQKEKHLYDPVNGISQMPNYVNCRKCSCRAF